MLAIRLIDSDNVNIPVITEKSLDEIVMDLYVQKRWNIVKVSDNSGGFVYPVKDGVVQKPLAQESSQPNLPVQR